MTDVEASTALAGVVLHVTVANNSSSSAAGTLYGEVDVHEGDAYTESKSITVSPNGSNSYRLAFQFDLADSLSDAEFDYEAWVEGEE